MTTREFINKAFSGDTKKQSCGSVFKDSNGDLFSYGYHYPLLFKIGGKVVRNVRGYSSTTSKHINWTRDIDAIDIHTLANFRLSGGNDNILLELIKGQKNYIKGIWDQMASKKRQDTQVYNSLRDQWSAAVGNLKELTN